MVAINSATANSNAAAMAATAGDSAARIDSMATKPSYC